MTKTQFIFTTCNIGSESALKKEISLLRVDLHSAYSRPGMVTFKNTGTEIFKPDFRLNSIFARTFGITLGQVDSNHEPIEGALARLIPEKITALHAYSRDAGSGWKNDFDAGEFVELNRGAAVVHLIQTDESEFLVGFHLHHEEHSPFPAALPPIIINEKNGEKIPSRAYLKLKQAIQHFHLKPECGETALEFGSSPGGSCLALYEMGLNVIGVDVAEMPTTLKSRSSFKHLQKNTSQVGLNELPKKIDWILSDMNIPPDRAVLLIKRFIVNYKPTLKGLILTAKMKNLLDFELVEKTKAMLSSVGFGLIRMKQLPSHGSEFCIVAT